MKDKKYAIGLMSGTSLDGIDVVLTEISGSKETTDIKLLAFESYEMDETLKKRIQDASHP